MGPRWYEAWAVVIGSPRDEDGATVFLALDLPLCPEKINDTVYTHTLLC